jgi:membrane-associated protease RseP (regulator of RpoE activity)
MALSRLNEKHRNIATGGDVEIRKQVYDLTLADVKRFPVWEFALDEEGEEGQDEATVRPFQFVSPLNPNDGMFIVQADFTLADGTPMEGYLTTPVQGVGGIRTFQPIIITEQGQVNFWYGILEPNAETVSRNYRLLGKNASQIFPIRFKSAVEVLGGPIEGDLQGFLYFKIDRSRPLGLDDLPVEAVR